MASSKHAPAKVLCSLRQREAAELRAQKLTLQETAEKMGISKPRVCQLLDSWDENFKSENTDRAEQIRAEQLEEIRLLKKVWFPRLLREGGEDEEGNKYEPASAKDLQAYMKIMSHEADLAGSKAATTVKTELTGKDGRPVQLAHSEGDADLSQYTTEQLLALAEIMQAAKKPE